jgi:hypothetical protein
MMHRVILVAMVCAVALALPGMPTKKNPIPSVRDFEHTVASLHKNAIGELTKMSSLKQSQREQQSLTQTAKCTQVQNLIPNCQTLGDITKSESQLHTGCAGSCMSQVRTIVTGLTDADAACIDEVGIGFDIKNLTLNLKLLKFFCSTISGHLCGDVFISMDECTNDKIKYNESLCEARPTNCKWDSHNNSNNGPQVQANDGDNGGGGNGGGGNNGGNNGQCDSKTNKHFFDTICDPCIRALFDQFFDVFGNNDGGLDLGHNATVNMFNQLICAKSSDQHTYCFQVVEEQPLLFVGTVAGGGLNQEATAAVCTNETIHSCARSYANYVVNLLNYAAVAGWQACLDSVEGTAHQKYVTCASADNLGADLLAAAHINRYLDAQCTTNSTGHYCLAMDVTNPNDPFVSCLGGLADGYCSPGCDSNVTQFFLESGCCGGALFNFAHNVVNLTFPRYLGTGTISPSELPYLGGVSTSTLTDCVGLTAEEVAAPSFSSCNASSGGSGSGSGSGSNGGSTVTVSLSMTFNINYDALKAILGDDFSSVALGIASDLSTITGLKKSAFRKFKFFGKGTYATRRSLFEEASALGTNFEVAAPAGSGASVTSSITNAVASGANFQATLTAVQSSCTSCVSGTTLTPTGVSASSGAALAMIATLLALLATVVLIL